MKKMQYTQTAMAALFALLPAVITGPAWAEEWKPARLSDGQPDVRGFYKPVLGGTYSLLRPRRGIGVEEMEEWEASKKNIDLSQSRIVDPPTHRVPYQAWALAKQQDTEKNMYHWTKSEHIDPQARCVPGGVTRTIFWTQDFELRQYPGYVVFVDDQNHTSRVIPLDNRPHIDEKIKLWMSDSRGHWEGTTLVVDVTNSNSKHRLSNEGDFASDKVHIVERYIFTGPNTFKLEQRFTDPSVYTQPWTLAADFRRAHTKEPGYELWLNECQEGERDLEHLYHGDKSQPY